MNGDAEIGVDLRTKEGWICLLIFLALIAVAITYSTLGEVLFLVIHILIPIAICIVFLLQSKNQANKERFEHYSGD